MKAQLKAYLLNNESIDLYGLFHQFQAISVYTLITELHALNEELQRSIKLSALVSQIDGGVVHEQD